MFMDHVVVTWSCRLISVFRVIASPKQGSEARLGVVPGDFSLRSGVQDGLQQGQ
jgi:hypothetical protein